jgi:hypothetical protein
VFFWNSRGKKKKKEEQIFLKNKELFSQKKMFSRFQFFLETHKKIFNKREKERKNKNKNIKI